MSKMAEKATRPPEERDAMVPAGIELIFHGEAGGERWRQWRGGARSKSPGKAALFADFR